MAPAPRFSTEEQERLIICAAIKAIEESNLLDFSMSAVAKLAGLSMGSVYKFVQCKEDVLIALATRMYQERQRVFKKVLGLPLTTPERIIATSLLDFTKVQMYSFDNQLESIVNTESMMMRCSERWLTQMITCGERCQTMFQQFLQDAADSGELTSGSRDIEEINSGTWSLTVGYFQTVRLHQCWHNDLETLKKERMVNASKEISLEGALTEGLNIAGTNIEGTSTTNKNKKSTVLAPNNVHIRSLKRLINTYDWQQNISDQDIEKICDQLTAAELR